jgi:serine/threonine protein kinase
MAIDSKQVQAAFLQVVAANPDERSEILDRLCQEDAELRRRVELLVRAHDDSGELPAAAGTVGTGAYEPKAADAASRTNLQPGDIFAGRYKLREKLGEGGMGIVWVADQTAPVQRRIALKVIKSSDDSRRLLARFEQERQALALMDHPNIAKVLDAGVSDEGRPYFIMELIKGVPLTKYCDEAKLTPNERLELFVPVCQAVQHAHQKGIIHRDLKPSNILVGLYDGRPVPKVIDFGVAKATGPRIGEQSIYTEVGAMIGTLEYMSPEQAELNNLDIDTRSDIYSLGVILYELLTGSVPFSRKEMKAAGFAEMLRIIKEVEPPKPSTRLSGSGTLPNVAALRHTEPGKLTRLVRGELDWITMKALEKDRSRRYETANGLAADIQRYISGEPVQAHPHSTSYHLRKLLQKNRGAVIAAGIVLAALIAGVIGTSWQAIRAEQARDDESKQRRIADGNAETALEEAAKAAKAAEKANAATARANAAFDNAVDQFVGVRIPSTYVDQPVPFGPNEKEFLAILDKHYIEEAAAATDGRQRAAALVRSGMIRSRLGDMPGMESAMATAVREWEVIVGAGGSDAVANRRELGRVHDRYASLYPLRSKEKDIIARKDAQLSRAVNHWKQLAAEVPNDADLNLALAQACQVYGDWLWYENFGSVKQETVPGRLRSLLLIREGVTALQWAIVLRPTDPSLRNLQHKRFFNLESHAESLRRTSLDPSHDRLVRDILIDWFLASIRAAQQFPNTEIREPGQQTVKSGESALVHTYESQLADDLWRLLVTRNLVSNQQLLSAWTRALEQAKEFRYGKALLLEVKVRVYISELRAGGEASAQKQNATKAMIEETRRQARGPDVVFPPGLQIWRGVGSKTQIHLNDFTPEQRILLAWAETETLSMWPTVQEEVLNSFVATTGPNGNPLPPQSIDAIAKLYFAIGGWISRRLSKSTDDVQVAIRCVAAGRQLVKDREDRHVFWSDSVQYLNQCGRYILEAGHPERALPMFDLGIKLLAARKEWPVSSGVDPFAVPEETHFGRADALSHLGRYAEAVDAYAEAHGFAEKSIEFSLSSQPKERDSLRRGRTPLIFRYGVALLHTDRFQQAEAMFTETIRIRENEYRKYPDHPETHHDLYWAYYDCGSEYFRAEKWERAAFLFGKAATTLDEHMAKFFNVTSYKKLWEKEVSDMQRWSHQYRGMALERSEKYAEALTEFNLAMPFVPDSARSLFTCQRARLVALTGDHTLAAKTADEALSKAKLTEEVLYEAACVYALSAAAVKTDDTIQTKYAEIAVATLLKAVAAGWNNLAHLRKDKDLDSLRGRVDFKAIVVELEKKNPPKPVK